MIWRAWVTFPLFSATNVVGAGLEGPSWRAICGTRVSTAFTLVVLAARPGGIGDTPKGDDTEGQEGGEGDFGRGRTQSHRVVLSTA